MTGFDVANGRTSGVRLRDEHSAREYVAHGAVVVNAAGPWADDVLAGLPGDRPRLIGGTKGSHMIVGEFPGAPKVAVYTEAVDNRPYFIVPWAGNYLIGTTDERFDGDLDEVVATESELAYLLESTNQVIPTARLRRDDVLWAYAGVRPLPYVPTCRKASSPASTSSITTSMCATSSRWSAASSPPTARWRKKRST